MPRAYNKPEFGPCAPLAAALLTDWGRVALQGLINGWRAVLLPGLRGNVVHVATHEGCVAPPGGHVHRFIELPAIRGQLIRPAHFVSTRIFFIADQPRSVKLRGDFLITLILGFL